MGCLFARSGSRHRLTLIELPRKILLLLTPFRVSKVGGGGTEQSTKTQHGVAYMPRSLESVAVVFEKLDEVLTNSSKVAAIVGDDLLVYFINMAVLHVRRKAAHLDGGPGDTLVRRAEAHRIAVSQFLDCALGDLQRLLTSAQVNLHPHPAGDDAGTADTSVMAVAAQQSG